MQGGISHADVIIAAQCLASLILAALVWRDYRRREHHYLRYWAFAWLSLAIYAGINSMSDLWFARGTPFALRWLLWSSIAHMAVYSAGVLFVAGGRDLWLPDRMRRRHLYLALALGWVLATGLVLGSAPLGSMARYLMRTGLANLWLGVAALTTAVLVGRVAAARQGRTHFLTVTASVFGLLKLSFFLGIALALHGHRMWMEVGARLGSLDLLFGFCFGLGMLIWQIEDESQAVIDATNALRESEKRLRQSQKMEAVGQLAGGIAHDFNNLLTVIQGYSEILALGTQAGSDVHQAADEIKRATARASTLTQNLLAFSRRQVLEPRSVEMGELVHEISAVADRLTGERIDLTVHTGRQALPVHLDPGQFQQVMLNLIINARDAMPDGGKISIVASRVEGTMGDENSGWCLVTVSDNGLGMAADILGRIFDPFFSTKSEGSGLGLPTAAGIVALSGGRIEVESTVGEGSLFSIFLPLAQSGDAQEPEPARRRQTEGQTIMLVEDEDSVRKLVTVILSGEGFTVRPQASAEEAIQDLESGGRADLVLTDVVLPGMSGPEFIDEARGLRPGLPAVMMTGYAAEAAPLIQETPYEVIRKPFDRERILDAVYRSLAG